MPLLLLSACFASAVLPASVAFGSGSQQLPIGYTGVDYYYPSDYFTHCPEFTWLRAECWNNTALSDPPRQQLISDLKFDQNKKVVSTMRVWISLDQLMQWNSTTGFAGWQPGALANVDDMLSIFHQYRIPVVLVLFSYSEGVSAQYQFHPEALDGDHSQMRANYLTAVSQFMSHLEANSVDVQAAPIVEIQNEVYYQLERYFSTPSNLGSFESTCAPSGTTDWGCVDNNIIHPWLDDLYQTAKAAGPDFLYTFSDTARLFHDYSYWNGMYPEDIIDEHVYDSQPWNNASLYAAGLTFTKPWIVTESGCNTGDTSCTYNGTNAETVDSWWLDTLSADGAQSVMVESHVTVWTYPAGPDSQTPTEVGTTEMNLTNSTPTPTPTPSPTSTPTPTPAPTSTPTPTPAPTSTPTPTPAPTSTPTPTPAPTSTPTPTPAPTSTPTSTPAPTPTSTLQTSPTPTPTPAPPPKHHRRGGDNARRVTVARPVTARFYNFRGMHRGRFTMTMTETTVSGSSIKGSRSISVEQTLYRSSPNGLTIHVVHGHRSSRMRYRRGTVGSFQMHINIRFGRKISLRPNGHPAVVTLNLQSPNRRTAKLRLRLGINRHTALCIASPRHRQRCAHSQGRLVRGRWHRLRLTVTKSVVRVWLDGRWQLSEHDTALGTTTVWQHRRSGDHDSRLTRAKAHRETVSSQRHISRATKRR